MASFVWPESSGLMICGLQSRICVVKSLSQSLGDKSQSTRAKGPQRAGLGDADSDETAGFGGQTVVVTPK